ncbi:MAG: hypothetical protein V2I39_00965, partial [Erythrobacter sp.]|nr:hypothetical protein [Erythrobacter sp.]
EAREIAALQFLAQRLEARFMGLHQHWRIPVRVSARDPLPRGRVRLESNIDRHGAAFHPRSRPGGPQKGQIP